MMSNFSFKNEDYEPENNCVVTMFVLRTSEAMIVWQKNAEMWLVTAFQSLVCAPFGKFELNSNFPKFYFG